MLATLVAGCPARPGEVTTAPSPAKAPEHVTCTGKVVDAEGSPVAGAAVTACKWSRKYHQFSGTAEVITRTTSKADGSFSFRAPAGEHWVSVVAEKDGLAIGWESLDLREGKTEATIKLDKPLVLAGAVVDEAGAPIRGARVAVDLRPAHGSAGRSWLYEHDVIESLVAKTGGDGRFEFRNVPPGCTGEFRVEAAGRAALRTEYDRRRHGYPAPATDIELVLPPEGRIEATVVEKATGRPVGEVALMAEDVRSAFRRLGECVSKKEGRFRWDKLPAGGYQLAVAAPGEGTPEWVAGAVRVEVKAGQTAGGVKVELTRGGGVELAFIDAEGGQPVRYPNVGLWNKKEGLFTHTTGTAEDGVVRLRLLPGEYNISWVAADHYSMTRAAGVVTVEPDKTARLEIKLKKSPRFHGVVLDPAGRPLPGATVCTLPGRREATTDEQGKYELWQDFQRWPYHKSFLLLCRHTQRNLAAAAEVSDPAKPTDLKLAPALSIAGKVTGPAGKPIGEARVSVLIDQSEPDPRAFDAGAATNEAGRYEVRALPPGRDYVLRFEAKGCATVDVVVPCPSSQQLRTEAASVTLRPVQRIASDAVAREIAVPEIPGGWAIWGSTGRDARGHIWFGVSAHEVEVPSAHLFEYDPAGGEVTDRGDVVSRLKEAGVYRQGEGQMKIHTKIVQAGEHLYFCSMDEQGEDQEKGILPTWGGHLWRLRLKDNRWEHLKTVPEALIAVAAGGKYVYALGYLEHVLYQYDTASGDIRSVKVGAIGGHVSRNFLCDRRGHVYVPRVEAGQRGGPAASLVEYDGSLKEIAQTPLKYYFHRSPVDAHGITGHAMLPDGSIAFVTQNGWLSLVEPSADGPAKVTELGWFHPNGPRYSASLFADSAGRYLMGLTRGDWDQPYDWVVYDLKTGTHRLAGLRFTERKGPQPDRAWLFGCQTRDDAGDCYAVGVQPTGEAEHRDKP
ncbi:MAG: hypothetical protein AMJ81_02100, partial [Phycisphaerae bacterium SM23_33]